MTENLLEQQESPGIIVAHQHLVVGEGLAERMSSYLSLKTERTSDFLQYPIDGHSTHRLVQVPAVVGFAAEHEVAETDAGGVLQIQRHSIDHGVVDRDVTILPDFAGVRSLLLQDRECGSESKFIIDQVTEPETEQVADSKTEIDSYDEQHIISVPSASQEPGRHLLYVLNILNRFRSVLAGDEIRCVFDGGRDQTGGEDSTRVPYFSDVDRAFNTKVDLDNIILQNCQLPVNLFVYIITPELAYVNGYSKIHSVNFEAG